MPDSLPTTHPNPWIAGLMAGMETTSAAEAELREVEANEEAARAQPGGDVGGTAMQRPPILAGGRLDALAVLRDDLPLIRLGSRRLGPDFAPAAEPTFKPDRRPMPKGVSQGYLTTGHAWRRNTLPPEGWHFGGTRPADGAEACAWCARTLRKGQAFAIVAHPDVDVVMSCCPACASDLIGARLVIEGADPSPWLPINSVPAMLRDPSMWRGDMDTGMMSLDLSEDFQVRLMQTREGVAAEIDFPDLAGETTVVGTYRSHGEAMSAVYFEIVNWEQR